MLEIRDFSKTYKGGKRAVDHLSLRVEPGSTRRERSSTARLPPR